MTKRVPIVMLPFTVSRHMPGACAGLHRPAASLVHFWLLPVPQPHRITDEPVVVPPPLTSKQKVLPDVDAVWMRLGLGSTPDTNAWLPGWLLEPVQVARATRLLQSLLPLTCRHRELVLPPTRRELGTVIGPAAATAAEAEAAHVICRAACSCKEDAKPFNQNLSTGSLALRTCFLGPQGTAEAHRKH
jgi:hypothetical protein